MHRGYLAVSVALCLASCTSDPNMPDQDVVHRVEGRNLTVGYSHATVDWQVAQTGEEEEISAFPLVGPDGILVRDLGDVPLTEDDQMLAQTAAETHCRAFRRRLAETPAIFLPAEAGFLFGRCEP